MNKVYLIGAGPGDPDLITVKALRVIECADVILYDALMDSRLLDYAPDHAELIYVGKRCGKHSLKQEDINTLITQKAQRHKTVVRLKGGDPFVFGRGYEEIEHLRQHQIQTEVIPGISSVTGVSSSLSVPLTSRGVAESFWVLTGTTRNHKLSADITLAAKSTATLVILMGMRNLSHICEILVSVGKQDVPIMVVQNGTRSDETIALGNPQTITKKLLSGYEYHPGIIIVGEVVALHPEYVKNYTLQTWTA